MGFDYGQRHRIELECRETVRSGLAALNTDWGARLGADHMLDATVLKSLGETAMTHEVSIEMTEAGLPSTFVPGRNLLFLTLAGALASRRGIAVLVGGMCETDYSGYPDCRADTMAAQAETLRLGLDVPMQIETPLMYIDKAESLGAGGYAGRAGAGRSDRGRYPYVLSWRAGRTARMGIWLWHMPRVRVAGKGVGKLEKRQLDRFARYSQNSHISWTFQGFSTI